MKISPIISNFCLLKKPSLLLLVFAAVLLANCSGKDLDDLNGTWRVDSIYNFYNGFDFTNKEVHALPLLHFEAEGQLRMTKDDETRLFLYELRSPDTVVYKTRDGRIMEKSVILTVSRELLALKKELPPVFKGKGQHRYEIKYFSRVKE